ncbi:MAG: glycosyltransferase family 4 protein [Candidatus Pacebacteria bacterium]|nr:glycosyltransferase family 4 protein [Candidatus Paceibacterota bacterium]
MTTIAVDIRVLATGHMSGIERYAEGILSHMIPLDSRIQWRLFSSGRTLIGPRSWSGNPRVQMFETRSSNRMLAMTSRLLQRPFLDRVIGGADVFFFPHFLLGALSSNCRRVTTWHDLSYERMPYLLSAYRTWWHDVYMQPRRQAAISDRIIAVSSATAGDLSRVYGVRPEKIAVVPSGVASELKPASNESQAVWRAKYGVSDPFILALGTREPRKNLPALVRAWDVARRHPSCQDMQLVLAGHAGWMESELTAAIQATQSPHAIHVIEDIVAEEHAAMLSAASILAYPSLMEGFGFPPLEAMACGTPVIASATSSLFETLGDAAILVNPYRVNDITAAIIALQSDSSLRARCVLRGAQRAHAHRWENAAQSTLEVLTSVL